MKYTLLIALSLLPLCLDAQSYAVSGNAYTYQRLASPNLLALNDDELSVAISPTGFSFEYFGATYTEFKVCSNGFLIMGSTGTTSSSIPFPSMAPGLTIAGLWRDHLPTQCDPGDGIGWEFAGGVLTVEWDEVPTTGQASGTQLATPYNNMQIVLDTGTGVIEFRYGDTNQTNGAPPAGDNNWYTCGLSSSTNPGPQELVHGTYSPYIGSNGEYLQNIADNYIRFEPQIAPTISGTPTLTATVGELWTYTFTATGSPAPVVNVTGLPAWLSLSGQTISGTPDIADVGTTGQITIEATNSVGTDQQQFQINVADVPPPAGGNGISTSSSGSSGCAATSKQQTWAGLALLFILAAAAFRRRQA